MSRNDPLRGFNFTITLVKTADPWSKFVTAVDLAITAAFSECSGLEATLQVEDYSEGGENRFVHRFPTRMTFSNIVLKRGVTFNQDLWRWHLDFLQGRGRRLDGLIVLLNEGRQPVRYWSFQRGLPLKWTGPVLQAGQNQVAIETLEIAHEGWRALPLSAALAQESQAFEKAVSALGATLT